MFSLFLRLFPATQEASTAPLKEQRVKEKVRFYEPLNVLRFKPKEGDYQAVVYALETADSPYEGDENFALAGLLLAKYKIP